MQSHFNLANSLTWLRIAAIPLLVLLFFGLDQWARPVATLMFTLAAITDWLDGYVARRLGQTSPFGAFLDPVADKLMVAVALLLIVQSDPREITAILAIIIIGREIAVSALREWMAELGARSQVAVSGYGKLKTIMQMIGVGAMLWKAPVAGLPVYDIGMVLLIVAAGLTLWSMVAYLRAAWPQLSGRA